MQLAGGAAAERGAPAYPAGVIVFDQAEVRFNLRVAGVAYGPNGVLLQQAVGTDFWFLPGGRVELLESADEALRRELREELGVEVTVERLLWVVENFFTLEGRRRHELGLYFQVALPPGVPADGQFAGLEPHDPLVFAWCSLEHLTDVVLHPSFLRTALGHPPASVCHLVHRDPQPAGQPDSRNVGSR